MNEIRIGNSCDIESMVSAYAKRSDQSWLLTDGNVINGIVIGHCYCPDGLVLQIQQPNHDMYTEIVWPMSYDDAITLGRYMIDERQTVWKRLNRLV